MIAFQIHYQVVPKQSAKFNVRKTKGGKVWAQSYQPKAVRDNAVAIAKMCAECAPEKPLDGPVFLRFTFRVLLPRSAPKWQHQALAQGQDLYRDKTPDLDNLEKQVMDAMTMAGFWHNDAQVVAKSSGKVYAEQAGVTIHVYELRQPTAASVKENERVRQKKAAEAEAALFEPAKA